VGPPFFFPLGGRGSLVCYFFFLILPDLNRYTSTPSSVDICRFSFEFGSQCRECSYNKLHFKGSRRKYILDIDLLNLLNVGTFLSLVKERKVSCELFREKIDSMPCYSGWYYSRILTNGDVIPCCKAAAHPLGNVYKKTFSSIWNSSRYSQFRHNAKNLPKSHKYFSSINCYKSCDNWGMNSKVNREFLRYKERITPPFSYFKKIKISFRDYLV
jgi:hypothetical protein